MLPLFLVLAAPVSVQPIDAERFRVTVLVDGDFRAQVEAQLQLAAEAKRQCRDRGKPVSGGTLEVNAPPKADAARDGRAVSS
jgi:hypothetical protein